jgi:hypothetical protein
MTSLEPKYVLDILEKSRPKMRKNPIKMILRKMKLAALIALLGVGTAVVSTVLHVEPAGVACDDSSES